MRDPLERLRRGWWGVALAAYAAWLAGALLLSRAWSPSAAIRWALLAGLVLALYLAYAWRMLPLNHPEGRADVWPGLGAANLITLARGVSAALLSGLLAAPEPTADLLWLPAALHAAAVFPDFFDGYVARVTGRVTVLGGRLDMEADSIAMLAATLLAVRYGAMPWWFAAVGLARYLYVLGLWLRWRRGLPVAGLSFSRIRRVVAGLMMGFANLALWPILDPGILAFAGLLLTIPHLGGFTRDWLVVSGMVDPAGAAYTRIFAALNRFVDYLMPALRALGGVAAFGFLLPSVVGAFDGAPALLLALVVAGAGALFVLGAAGRSAALVLLAVGAADLVMTGLQPYHFALVLGALPVLVFGPGRWALWLPDEPIFARPVGER